MTTIETAVFPVAGLGTRFLPVTKAGPKEMLPIVDKPLIQYAVEEAIAAGMRQLVFITSGSKRAIEDYFDSHDALAARLKARGQTTALAKLEQIVPDDVDVVYVRQPQPLGLGDAVLRAKCVVGQAPFAVLLADDIMDSPVPCLTRMVEHYQAQQASIVAVMAIEPADIHQYGVVSVQQQASTLMTLTGIVEKPNVTEAPSNLGVVGRYILTPKIFDYLTQTHVDRRGEVQLTDAIAKLLRDEMVYAYRYRGQRYDCGHQLGFVEATIAYALKRPAFRQGLLTFMMAQLQEKGKAPFFEKN